MHAVTGELYQCFSFERIFSRLGGDDPSGCSGGVWVSGSTRHLISSKYSLASEMVAKPLGIQNSSSWNASVNIRFVGGDGVLSLLLRSAREGPSRRINAHSSSSSIGADAGDPLGLVREFR